MRNRHFHIGDYQSQEAENRYQEDVPYTKHYKIGLNKLVEEQAFWLRVRGYDEKGLNNNEQEGSYKEHLKEGVRTILNSDVVLLDKEPFIVHSFGLFGEKDKVHFAFKYEYNSFDQRISLKEVEATLNQVSIATQIEMMDDLWPSNDLYQRTKELSEPIVAAVKENRKENIQQLIAQTSNSLKGLEYEKYSDKSKGWIEKRLTKMLGKAESKPDSIYYFNLHTKLQNGAVAIKASIQFEYVAQIQYLNLRRIHAKLGNYEETVLQQSKAIPKAGDLITTIQHKQSLAKANKISQGPEQENRNTLKKR